MIGLSADQSGGFLANRIATDRSLNHRQRSGSTLAIGHNRPTGVGRQC